MTEKKEETGKESAKAGEKKEASAGKTAHKKDGREGRAKHTTEKAEATEKIKEKPAPKGKKAVKGRPKPEKPSKRPKGLPPGVPSWVEVKPKEIEEAIINLANSGHNASQIGTMLRDQYGVPDVKTLCSKSISEILKEHNLLGEIPEDLMNLIRRSVALSKHLEKNRKDFAAKRGYQLTVSKIRRLVNHYHKKGRLPKGWRFSDEKAALLVK